MRPKIMSSNLNKVLVENSKVKRLLFLQTIVISVFISIVFADHFILESILKPYEILDIVNLFHFAYFTVLTTVVYAALGAVYMLARGVDGWRVGLGIFIEGMILVRLGFEDILYYTLFGSVVPDELPWLNYNPIMVASTFAVTKGGLIATVILSLAIITVIWSRIWRHI